MLSKLTNVYRNGGINGIDEAEWKDYTTPWVRADKPPIAVVGSGPAGLINAYLLSVEGYPVTVFEAFHDLGGVLRYGIPEFRLPNALIDNVVGKIDRLGGNERTRNLLALKNGLELDEVLPVSAKTGYGVKELWARIEALAGQPAE